MGRKQKKTSNNQSDLLFSQISNYCSQIIERDKLVANILKNQVQIEKQHQSEIHELKNQIEIKQQNNSIITSNNEEDPF